MNHKHLSCMAIGGVIALMMWLTMQMKGKTALMEDEARTAESAVMNASNKRKSNESRLTKLKAETKDVRTFLERWTPFLQQTEDQELAELRMTERIKQDGLVVLSHRFLVAPNKDGDYIQRLLRTQITFEDDFARCMQWLGGLEQNLPASRVTLCKMSKGQNANDLKMELTIDVPLTGMEEEKGRKKI